jgi:hypothetical protein
LNCFSSIAARSIASLRDNRPSLNIGNATFSCAVNSFSR